MPARPMTTDPSSSGDIPSPSAPFSYVPGNRLDRFEITEQYRYGAFKEVYLARDVEHPNGVYVLKVVKSLSQLLDPALMSSAGTADYNMGFLRSQVGDARARRTKFEQEVSIMRRRLSGCNSVAQVYHQGIFSIPGMSPDNEVLYFVEEYIPGETLTELLTRNKTLPPEKALILFRQIAEALVPIHQENVSHRDVKGSNILVVPEGTEGLGVERVAFTDFGNSSVLGSRYIQVGSILYRSPEQLKGAGFPGGQKSDMWALGVLFYEALSGNYPFATSKPDWRALTNRQVSNEKAELRDKISHRKLPLPFPNPTSGLELHLNAVIVGRPGGNSSPSSVSQREAPHLLYNQLYLLDRRRERRSNAKHLVNRLRALETSYGG